MGDDRHIEERATPPAATARDARVIWVSHGYGYAGDLMYFGEIFRALRGLLPNMVVVTDPATRYRNPYAIPLLPIMPLVRRAISRISPDGQIYETEAAFPRPDFALALRRLRADVLVAIEFTAPALVATLVAALTRRTRLLLLVESDPARRGGSRNPLVRRIKRWAVARADAIQTNNEPGRRYLVEDLGADPEKVRVAPYLTSRPPGPAPDLSARTGPVRLLFANSITPRKGVREMLGAIAVLDPGTRAQIVLTVIGEGPEREAMERLARELDLAERVRFVGRVPYASLGAFYAEADVLLIPSLADYRSLTGFEGLGYGLALLASDKDGATAETVVEGVNGYAIDPARPSDLAMRIAELVSDRNRLAAMRQASLELYESRFSIDLVAGNLAQSVECALDQRR